MSPNTWRYRVWQWFDSLLLAGIFVLLAGLTLVRYGGRGVPDAARDGTLEQKPSPPRPSAPASLLPPGVPPAPPRTRAPDAVARPMRVSTRGDCDSQTPWREKGVRDVEWDALPPLPGLDMMQTDRGYMVAVSLPHARDEEIRVDCASGLLVIRSARVCGADAAERHEIFRRIRLPADTVADGAIQRTFSNGVLRVFIPRAPQP